MAHYYQFDTGSFINWCRFSVFKSKKMRVSNCSPRFSSFWRGNETNRSWMNELLSELGLTEMKIKGSDVTGKCSVRSGLFITAKFHPKASNEKNEGWSEKRYCVIWIVIKFRPSWQKGAMKMNYQIPFLALWTIVGVECVNEWKKIHHFVITTNPPTGEI